jgi:FkbM family methyltransferase
MGFHLTLACFVIVSALMLNVNKLVLRFFPAPYFLSLLQALTTCVFLYLLEVSRGRVELSTRQLRNFIIPGMLWAFPLVFNLQSLRYLNPETLIVFRAFTVLGVSAGDFLVLRRTFKRNEFLSMLVIILGSILYVSGDLHFNTVGYMWGAAYTASLVCCMLAVKVAFDLNKDVGTSAKTFYLNFVGCFIFTGCMLVFEYRAVHGIINSLNSASSALLLTSCVLGVFMGYLGSATRDELSPTTFDVVTNVAKFLTIAVSWVLFKTKYSPKSLMGIHVALIGGALYSPHAFRAGHVLKQEVTRPVTWLTRILVLVISVVLLLQYSHGFSSDLGFRKSRNTTNAEEKTTASNSTQVSPQAGTQLYRLRKRQLASNSTLVLSSSEDAATYFLEAIEDDHSLMNLSIEIVAIRPYPIRMMHSLQFEYQRKMPMEFIAANIIHMVFGSKSKCSSAFCTFVDMGMNDGFYAMLASALGSHVRTIEPQPNCIDRFSAAMVLNPPRMPLHVYNAFVGTKVGFGYNERGLCIGSHGGSRLPKDNAFIETPFVTLDTIVGEAMNVTLLHIDSEGAEIDILRSATKLVRQKRIQNMIIELKPVWWHTVGVEREEGITELLDILKWLEMKCVHLEELHACRHKIATGSATTCTPPIWDPSLPTSFSTLQNHTWDVDLFCTSEYDVRQLAVDVPHEYNYFGEPGVSSQITSTIPSLSKS